jgi:hypothetical protein
MYIIHIYLLKKKKKTDQFLDWVDEWNLCSFPKY